MNKSVLTSALLASVLSVTTPALAEPQGGEVRAGSATIQQTLGTTTIRQLTERAIIDWQRFGVNANELVRFIQPSEMAVILNRVTGGDPSVILGKLQANGQLFLVNPNGILFGPGSQVDVGSLVATTLSLSNEDFLAGNYRFVQDPSFNLASVVNQGTITVSDEGYVVLTAPLVSNEGLIVANLGKVALGAGNEVTLNLDGRNLVSYQLSASPSEGGTVALTPEAVSNVLQGVVNDGSLVPAGSMREENGQVMLVGAEGTLVQGGTIQAGSVETGSSQVSVLTAGSLTTAGEVRALGRNVVVQGTIDASGAAGGGTVLVGGPARGQGPEQRALTTRLEGAVRADALDQGDGGTIVVWSDERTDISGTLSAVGAEGGQGGFIETSSRRDIHYTGDLTTGPGGTWLWDPTNTTIVSSITGANQILASSINTQLDNSGTFALDTNGGGTDPGFIAQNDDADIIYSGSGAAALTLTAGSTDGSILLSGDIEVAGTGTLDVTMTAGTSSGSDVLVGDIATNGGALDIQGGGRFEQEADTVIDAGAGAVSLAMGLQVDVDDVLGGTISITSGDYIDQLDGDLEADLTAGTALNLSAVTGIGSVSGLLEISSPSVAATSSGVGLISLVDLLGDATFTTVSTNDGSVTLESTASGTTMTVTSATAGGDNDLFVQAGANNLVLGTLNAAGNVVDLDAGGTVNHDATSGNDIVADSAIVTGTAVGNLGALEIDVASVILGSSAGGTSVIDTAGGLSLNQAVVTDGNLNLTVQGGDLTVFNTIVSGTGATANLTTQGAGSDLLLDSLSAPTVSLTSAGAIAETGDGAVDLSATNLSFTAAAGFGAGDGIETAVTNLTSGVASSGNIDISNTGVAPMGVTSLSATTGNISLFSSLNLTAGSITALGTLADVALSGNNDILVDDVRAADQLSAQSINGRILESGNDAGADLTAGNGLTLSAQNGIGTLGAVEISTPTLTASSQNAITVHGTTGAMTLASVASSSNSVTVTHAGGNLVVTSLTTGASGIATLSASAGSLLVGSLTANTASLSAPSATIEESGSDAEADVTAGTITLSAGNGIGTLSTLEVQAATLNANVASGSIDVADIDAVTVASATTTGGTIALSAASSLTATSVTASGVGSDVILSSGGPVLVASVTAADTIDIDAVTSITETGNDATPDLVAPNLVLSSGTGVGGAGGSNILEVDATNLTATVSGTGVINVADTAGGLVVDASTSAGNITLAAADGDLDLHLVDAPATSVQASTTGAGSDVRAGSVTATSITLSSAGGILDLDQDAGADLTAATVSLTAATGIGTGDTLELEASTLSTASVSAAGIIDLADTAGGLTVTSASTSNGDITLAANGALTLSVVTAGGAGDVAATTTAGGDLLAHNVSAAGDSVTLTSAGAINEPTGDPGADVTAATATLTAASGLGNTDTLEVDVTSLIASVTGVGSLSVQDTLGGMDATASTADGAINLSTAGSAADLRATSVSAGNAGAVSLSTITVGSGSEILLDSVSGGTVTLSANGSIEAADVDAGPEVSALSLAITTAALGVGTTGSLEVDVVNLSTGTIAAGGIDIFDSAGGLNVTGMTLTNGDIMLTASSGNLSVSGVSANGTGGDVTLATVSSGNVLVDSVSAALDNLIVNSSGTIEEPGAGDAGADLTAGTIILSSVGVIGGANAPLEVDATVGLQASTSGVGSHIAVQDINALTALDVSTADANISLSAAGVLTASQVTAGGAGDITLVTTSGGNLLVGSVTAAGDSVTITSSGLLDEAAPGEGTADIVAADIVLNSAAGMGTNGTTGAIELDATNSLTASNTSGNIVLLDTAGGLNASNVQATNGNVNLTAAGGGDLNVVSVTGVAASNTVTLATTGGGDVLLGQASAGSAITVNSSGSVQDVGNDAGTDLTAPTVTLSSATGIGTAGSLEIAATTLANALVTGTGLLDVNDVGGGLTVTNASTNNGHILLSAGDGTLTVTAASAGGAGSDLTLTNSVSGNIAVGNVSATDVLTVNAFGALNEAGIADAGADMTAASLVLTASTGIGATGPIEIEAGTLTSATVSGTGVIALADMANGLIASSVTTNNGAITLSAADGDLVAGNLSAGTGGLITLTTTGAGSDVLIDQAVTTGNIAVTSAGAVEESAPDGGADLQAASVSLLSGAGVGSLNALELLVTTVSSTTATTGNIHLVDLAGGLAVTSAQATAGSVTLQATGGALAATTVSAGGAGSDATLITTGAGNDLTVSSVTAGDLASLTSAGRIEEIGAEGTADVTAPTIALSAAGHIGGTSDLEIQASTLTAAVSGDGLINLVDTSGGVVATSLTTTNGNITLVATSGALTATLVEAGTGGSGAGNGNVVLNNTGAFDLLVGDVRALGDSVSLNSGRAIEELGADGAADVTAATLSATGAGGVGVLGTLEVEVGNLSASSTAANGHLALTDLSGGVNVTSATTSNGHVTLTAVNGDLALGTVTAGTLGSDVTLATTTAGNILLGNVTAADAANVTAAGSILENGDDAGADLTGLNLTLLAASGIGAAGNVLDVNATSSLAQAQVSGAGDIFLNDTAGGMTVASATTTNGTLSLSATSGALTVASATAGGALQLSTVGSGNLVVDNVTGTTASLTSAGQINASGADAGAEITAPTVTLQAGSGIGISPTGLDLEATNLTALVTGTGAINLTDLSGGLSVTSASTVGSGTISLTAVGGNLTATAIAAGGANSHVNLSTVTSGHILVRDVNAAGDTITLNSAGAIVESVPDAGADLIAATLTMTAATSIGQANAIETDVDTLSAVTNGVGNIVVGNTAGNLTAASVATNDGLIDLTTTSGNLTVTSLTQGGAHSVALGTLTTGNVLINQVTATGNPVTVTSAGTIEETGSDPGADILAGSIVFDAVSGIGLVAPLELESNTLTLATDGGDLNASNNASAASTVNLSVDSAAGDITFTQAGAQTLGLTASTTNGFINVTNNADIQATSVVAGGIQSVTLTATGAGSDIFAGLVSAAGDPVSLIASSGRVEELGADGAADVVASNLTLTTASGVGTAGTLEIDATTLTSATASGAGAIALADTAGGLAVTTATTFDGDLSISAANGGLAAGTVTAGGAADVALTTTGSGNVTVNNVTAAGDAITVSSAGSIEETSADAGADLTAGSVDLAAASGIGAVSALEVASNDFGAATVAGNLALAVTATAASTGSAQVTGGAGSVTLTQTGNQSLTLTAATATNGSVSVTNNADLEAQLVTASGAGSDASLTTSGSGSDVVVGAVSANDQLTVTAAGTIEESGADAGSEFVAGTVTLSSSQGIGTAGTVEMNATTLTASASSVGGIDLRDLAGGVTVTSATTSDGAISLAATNGLLDAVLVTAGGTARDISLTTTTAGDVRVGAVTASGDLISVSSAGAIEETGTGDTAVDLTSGLLDLTASTGIGGAGALEVNAATGTTANVTGVGGIALVDPLSGFVVTSAVTADGAISLTADGGILDAQTVTAGGTGRNVTLTTTTSGNVLGGNVSATGDTVTVTAVGAIEESGSDTTADFTANQLTLSAGTGIGAAGTVEVAATTLTAAVSGNGSLNAEDRAGGMTVASATTTNGSINLGAVGGDLTLTNVVAAGTGADVTVTTTTSGNILVNLLSAPDTLTVSSAGLIDEVTPTDTSADFVAPTIHLDAVAGAGVANLLRLDTTTANATVSGAGRIFLLDVSGGVTYNNLSTTSGEIRLNANNGNMDVVQASVGGTSAFSAVTNGSGNIRVGQVSAPNNQALLRSQGSIEEISADGGADVISKTARLEAVTGIGSLSALETETNTIVLLNVSQPGSASIVDLSGGLVVNSANTFNGSISLQTTGGLLNGKRVIAGGAGNVTLATITSGDIRFSEIRATANDLTMTSAGLIQETSQDPATDLFARNLTMSAVSGIGSSPATTIEADSVFLTASVSGAGGIFVNDRLGNVTLNLSTANGPINIGGVATMSAPSVQAGGANDVTLTSTGKVLVGNIVSGGAVFVTGTSVNELTPDPGVDITAAGDSELHATSGTIGVVDALEVSITNATLGVSATRQSGGVSVRIDGVVSPTDALIKLNAPPGQVLFNGVVQ